jgi:hypothetical protein
MNRAETDKAHVIESKQQVAKANRRLTVAPACKAWDCALDVPAPIHASGHSLRPAASEEPLPIWLAVLLAAECQARGNGTDHHVRWDCVAGRAVYTNYGRDAEHIEPLGVSLSVGETLAVYWIPGETAYTMEVYSQAEKCA